MYADLAIENRAFKEKTLTPTEKREAVHTMQETHGVSIVRGCAALRLARAVTTRRLRIGRFSMPKSGAESIGRGPFPLGGVEIYRSFTSLRASLESQADLPHLAAVETQSPPPDETSLTYSALPSRVCAGGSQ